MKTIKNLNSSHRMHDPPGGSEHDPRLLHQVDHQRGGPWHVAPPALQEEVPHGLHLQNASRVCGRTSSSQRGDQGDYRQSQIYTSFKLNRTKN
jgi:hypothetical protein